MTATGEPPYALTPIGVARSPFVEKMQAPRQPDVASGAVGSVELYAGRGFEHALEDLGTFRYVWLIFWFDRAEGWRAKVLPPRSKQRRGLFATRSPHRPNPIGLSLVELTRIEGLVLHVKGLDLLDGTPILDVKPYVPYADSRPDAGHGWLDESASAAQDPIPAFEIEFTERAVLELELLESFGVELEAPIRRVLELGPEPHPYRRIRKAADGACLALKDFRVRFTSEGRRISITAIETGYRPQQLATLTEPALEAHRALARLGRSR